MYSKSTNKNELCKETVNLTLSYYRNEAFKCGKGNFKIMYIDNLYNIYKSNDVPHLLYDMPSIFQFFALDVARTKICVTL